MEAPDKIYLQRNTTTDLYDEFWPEWFEDTHHPDSDICYIRKDALLKWAKEKRAALLNCDATEERKVAALSVCDAFIEKIKSL